MTVETPTCCCCDIKTGTTVLLSILIGLESIGVIFFGIKLFSAYDLNLDGNYMLSPTTCWIYIAVFIIFVILASLALHGVKKNQAGLLVPLLVGLIIDFVLAVIQMVQSGIYFSQNVESYKRILHIDNTAGVVCLVVGYFLLLTTLRVYIIYVIYRCYKHISSLNLQQRNPPPAPQLQLQVGSAIYMPPAHIIENQKAPLIDEVDDYVFDQEVPPKYVV